MVMAPATDFPGPCAVRAVVISDLHLGGSPPWMMSRPRLLADFIGSLADGLRRQERLELVIAGDFVDFLAIPPSASFTRDAAAARSKLEQTMRLEPFGCVFRSLRSHVQAGHRLTILVGNHDVELCLPAVQQALLQELGASPHQVHFVDDGRAYHLGRALIEHGNRYDPVNENDWAGLRALASQQSRNEPPDTELRVSAGSQLVERVINPLKATYPFIDVIQPQGELVAFLLFALEPSLMLRVADIARMFRASRLQARNPGGLAPGSIRSLGDQQRAHDAELRDAFGAAYDALRSPRDELASAQWLPFLCQRDGVAAMISRGEPIPPKRLHQIRVVLRQLLAEPLPSDDVAALEQYGVAAARMARANPELQAIVMGHTHLPRRALVSDSCVYLNSGTWADRIVISDAILTDDSVLSNALADFVLDRRKPCPPTYVDLRVGADGAVISAELCEVHS